MTCTHTVGECTIINNDVKIGVGSSTNDRTNTNTLHNSLMMKKHNNNEHIEQRSSLNILSELDRTQPFCTTCLVCKDGVCTRRRNRAMKK